MRKLLEILTSLTGIPQAAPARNKRFVTIGNYTFAVAHSRKEMSEAMRMRGKNVTGYIVSHRT